MRASRKKTLLGEAHFAKVNEEQVSETGKIQQQQKREFDEEEAAKAENGAESEDEDRKPLSKLFKRKTPDDASLLVACQVKEEIPSVGVYEIDEPTIKRVRCSDDDQRDKNALSVMERAKRVQANLDPEFPSFFKLMLRPHVTATFPLRVPVEFSKKHMPEDDNTVVLVGENGETHYVNFRSKYPAFSGGWRAFSNAHKLQEGDVLIFQLVMPLKFKVHIVRRNVPEGDGALDCLNLDTNANQSNVVTPPAITRKIEVKKVDERNKNDSGTCKKAEEHLQQKIDTILGGANDQFASCRKDSPTEDKENSGAFVDSQNCRDQYEKCGKDSYTASMDGFQSSESFVDLHSFSIIVNGFVLDSELSESVRTKYYELCFSRKSYLHDHLPKSINPVSVSRMIRETVNIADAIQASGVFTSRDDYAVWDKRLRGFELLGMDVDFLRSRLNRLLRLTLLSKETLEFKRLYEVAFVCDRLEESITAFEASLNRLKQAKNELAAERDTLQKAYVQRYEPIFEEAARGPW